MLRLSNSTLHLLPAAIRRPLYNRMNLRTGIVHLGLGNFHRAHQSVYTEEALEKGSLDWAITGVSLRHHTMRDSLMPQDDLYSVGMRSGNKTDWRVIGALRSVLYAPQNPQSVLDAIANPETRIISLTITEKGYCIDPKNGALDQDHEDIVHDLLKPSSPRSAIGYLVMGLKSRWHHGTPLPAILSCDNLSANGKIIRAALIRFAELSDPKFADELQNNLICPSTMVDRIVPETTDQDRQDSRTILGLEDAWPVTTEPFSQWVIEDRFPLGRPAWDGPSLQYVENVEVFEHMKLGLLNASHTALAILGLLSGYETVAEAMHDLRIKDFIEQFMREDIAPVLEIPSGIHIDDYIGSLISRFENQALKHRLQQIIADSSQKIPQRFLPTIEKRRNRSTRLGRFAHVIAAYGVLIERQDNPKLAYVLKDPKQQDLISSLRAAGEDAKDRVSALLSDRSIFGNLGEDHAAEREIIHAYKAMRERPSEVSLYQDFQY